MLNYIYLLLIPIILLVGLIGNITGLFVIKRKRLKKIGPRNIYLYLFCMDTMYLIQIIMPFLLFAFNIDMSTFNQFSCKLYQYLNYSLDTQSSMLLVYISFERLILIKYPTRVLILRKNNIQFVYFLTVFIYNLIFYLPIPFYYKLQPTMVNNTTTTNNNNSTEYVMYCTFISLNSQLILGNMDLINRVLIPLILMIAFSSVLINHIYKSRLRIFNNNNNNNDLTRQYNRNNRCFQRDLKFAITSISLNLFYVLFNLPISIAAFFPNYYLYFTYPTFLILFYFSYTINFYIILITNSLVRNEFIKMLTFRK